MSERLTVNRDPNTPTTPSARLVALIACGGALVGVGVASPAALHVVLTRGWIAATVLVAATGLGLWIIRALSLHRAEVRWQLVGGAVLGLGALSLLMLGLGTLGFLHRSLWIALLILFAAAGSWRWRGLTGQSVTASDETTAARVRWLWLAAVPFAALGLIAAIVPPGILWPGEDGNGYDVLEYHFGGPRDYFDAGRISFLPHNIYSNFPFNVEMLYLLTFVLHGNPVAAVFGAKLLNALLAVLAVAAVWLAGREYGGAGGIVAGVVAASCPFLTYLCGIAYVENGMMMFTALALGAMIKASRGRGAGPRRWMLVAGLAAGLACGCKYTAVPSVLLPLGLAAIWTARRRRPGRYSGPILFALGAAVTFGPWLVKNAVFTGNPVFPLARGVFHERDGIWNDDGADRWHEGHLPDPAFRNMGGRLSRLWSEVLWSRKYGPAIPLGLLAGSAFLIARRRRGPRTGSGRDRTPAPDESDGDVGGVACWLMLGIGVAVWLCTTHLVGRFAVGLIVPVAILIGRTWPVLRGHIATMVMIGALWAVAAVNLRATVAIFREAHVFDIAPAADEALVMIRRGDWGGQAHLPVLNELADDGHRVLMIGDARRFYLRSGVDYCVVFNRNSFAEAADRLDPPGLMAWLREQGYGHVYVNWSEMRRLRGSRYGFWESIDRSLFERLTAVGLRPVRDFIYGDPPRVYGTLFEVAREAGQR